MTTTNIKGAIFDADGTLLDSMSLWDHIGEDYLKSLGITPCENLAQTFREMSLEQSAAYYRTHYGVTLPVHEIIDGINSLIARYYREEVPLKPGCAAFLRELLIRGVRMCVATATDAALIDAALTRCGVRDCFSSILCCTDIGAGKDRPDIYEAALGVLGTTKESTLVFEDALHALKTSKSAGFLTVGVYDPSEPGQTELRAAADWYLSDWHHVPDGFRW
ncbi:MAG: HAD family phosphatase [Ruminococcaceae bacterium]|nr:HAD family phosphatase [Oscillospiraceae bacterium]